MLGRKPKISSYMAGWKEEGVSFVNLESLTLSGIVDGPKRRVTGVLTSSASVST